MFEQSTLTSPGASKRLWATCIGVTGQVVLVGGAVLAPMLWPQILPPATLMTSLVSPGPPPPPKAPVVRPRPTQATTHRAAILSAVVYQPPRIPDRVEIIVDPPPEIVRGGVIGGMAPDGMSGGSDNGVLGSILSAAGAPPPRLHEAPHVAATPVAVAEVKRYKVGGQVKMAAILRRVEPVYPALAKQARVSGTVELRGVIGTDGRLREVTLISGHPLLARAAIDAVSQWVYAPTQLNGDPVEVVAPITVTFRLN